MKKTVLLALTLFLTVFQISDIFAQQKDVLAQANQLYAENKFSEAETAYKNLLETVMDEPTRAKIIYNLGMTYQQLTEYDKAIETFNLIFSMGVNDKEPGGSVMQIYRNYRHSAQWEIGNSYFAKGEYQNALNAFQTAKEKYPYQSWCGNCRGSREILYQKTVGITFESLGRYEDAVNSYLKVYHPRIIELYEFNGQFDDIKRIIREIEEPQILERQKKYAWTREKARENLPTSQVNKYIKIYELEKSGDISGLMKLAEKNSRFNNYYSDVVAKLLARHPQKVIPQIAIAVKKGTFPYIYYKILAYIAMPEAMKGLLQMGENIVNYNDAMAFVEAVNLAGEMGEEVFAELEQRDLHESMKWAINKNKTEKIGNKASNEKDFPKIKKVKLPKSL